MRLIPVYVYGNSTIYKFVYKVIDTGYLWYTRNDLTESATPRVNAYEFKRVVRSNT